MAKRQVQPHGNRDAFAAGLLLRDCKLTNRQIAAIVGCEPESLNNTDKYPMLARVRALIRAQRQPTMAARARPDRRRRGRTSLDLGGDES